MEIALTIFQPESFRRSPQQGTSLVEDWSGLVRWVSDPIVSEKKDDVGGFTLATLRESIRRKSHVKTVSALGVDHDAGTVSLEAGHTAIAQVLHLVYPTHSSTVEAPRWRGIIPFDRPVTLAEYQELWPVAAAQFAAAGIVLDKSAKDGCRLWYVPARRPGAPYEVLVGGEKPLAVDELLAIARAMAEDQEAERRAAPVVRPTAPDAGRYQRGAIERAARAIESGTEGERHYLVAKEAFSLARFGIGESAIMAALVPAAIRSMGEGRRKEIERTIRAAVLARGAA